MQATIFLKRVFTDLYTVVENIDASISISDLWTMLEEIAHSRLNVQSAHTIEIIDMHNQEFIQLDIPVELCYSIEPRMDISINQKYAKQIEKGMPICFYVRAVHPQSGQVVTELRSDSSIQPSTEQINPPTEQINPHTEQTNQHTVQMSRIMFDSTGIDNWGDY